MAQTLSRAAPTGRSLPMQLLLLVLVILLLIGGLPTWGYHSYGYAPSGVLTILLIILLVYVLMGRRRL
jgi:hypothetical protein